MAWRGRPEAYLRADFHLYVGIAIKEGGEGKTSLNISLDERDLICS